MTYDALRDLSERGVSIYLDDISRSRLENGDLQRLVEHHHVVGVTTNPAIFGKALADGTGYEETIRELALAEFRPTDALRLLTCKDVRDAADLLAPVHEGTNGRDGWVSLEVNPFYAHDTQATVAEARLLHWMVGRKNVMMKVPATDAGIAAVTELVSHGISVNVTVLFSLTRYRQAADAYMRGLLRAEKQARDLRTIRSVASFYLARLDDAVDSELDAAGTEAAASLRGRVALAHARLAQDTHDELRGSDMWRTLAGHRSGFSPQRLLWASTATKDDQYADTRYVTRLALPGSIITVPEETLRATADHGVVPNDPPDADGSSARAVLQGLDRLGISLDTVADRLEAQAVTGFQDAWQKIENILASRMRAACRGAASAGPCRG
ncbi:transaldolase [Streptomyces sp. NPDC007872]|uniref:transaldolase n=1 Tax=Streptomyces sp. NPDC007872 TaxID=3364782 RepID=UPI00367FC0DF